jgi:hypothetical protein
MSAIHRFYLKFPDGRFARLFWMKTNRKGELLLGAYSLDGSPATITHEFPERRWAKGDLPDMDVRYSEAATVSVPIDHFTYHADGEFHAKARGGNRMYSHVERDMPLSPDTPPFLTLVIASDLLSRYRHLDTPPKHPHVWMRIESDATLALNVTFAGARFPMAREAAIWMGRQQVTDGFVIRLGAVTAGIWGSPLSIASHAAQSRPPGTLFVFQWRRGQACGVKAFFLN